MILHSIAPLSSLLPADETPAAETIEVSGATLSGRRTPRGFEVSRVLSTDPAVYLNAAFAPGSIVEFQDLGSVRPTDGVAENTDKNPRPPAV